MSAIESFDVYDTAVVRVWLEPQEVFAEVERRMAEEGLPSGFAHLRPKAEALAASRAPGNEATFAEIRDALAEISSWSAATIDRAAELELEEEKRVMPVAEIVARALAARRAGHQVAFVSDMYLPEDFIRNRLIGTGLCRDGDEVIVSASLRASKRRGTVFPILKERWPGWSRHTGDNEWNDVGAPRQHGLDAVHFTGALPTPRERVLHRTLKENPLVAGLARAARVAGSDTPLRRIGAAISGPLMVHFLRWIEAEAHRSGLQRLHFVAREGEMLLAGARELDLNIDGRYLLASRQSLLRCLYRRPEMDVPFWIIDSDEKNVTSVLLNLGLGSPGDFAGELEAAGFPSETWALPLPWHRSDLDRLLRFLHHPAIDALLRDRTAELLTNARDYLGTCGLLDGTAQGFVDLGWSGTIQRALQDVLGKLGVNTTLTGFYLACERLKPGVEARFCLYGPTAREYPLEAYHTVLESLLPASHGQCTGYGRDGPECAPFPPLSAEDCAALQAGALTFCRYARAEGLADFDLLGVIKPLLRAPEQEEARALGAVRFDSGITIGSPLVSANEPGDWRQWLSRWRLPCAWPEGLFSLLLPYLPNRVRRTTGAMLARAVPLARRLRWRRRGRCTSAPR